jgi:hypothetical protein
MDEYIIQAAKAAGYEKGFGIQGCELSKPTFWVAYQRQSQEDQYHNNRLPDYLHTCAIEAKRLNVTVPREYILYDLITGEHLERPAMIQLRKLMAEHRIAGIIFPALDRLSREPLHQQIFELEATHYGVQLYYADAPSGDDPGSQFARTILAHAAKLVKIANKRNNTGGNIGRVINRNVPAGKTPYGYKYYADYEDLGHGRRKLLKAWWEIDRIDSEGNLEWGSEAWVVAQTFHWIGDEERTLYWVAKQLNELNIKPRYTDVWSPSLVSFIVKKRCYTGHHFYNRAAYVPNPKRPLGDLTSAVRRTLRRSKAETEWVSFDVPPLVSNELWERSNQILTERGRGRGKEGRSIEALLRRRTFCPSCGQPLTVYRDSNHPNLTYYICRTRSQGWKHQRCHIRSFRVERLDTFTWDCVAALLSQPALVEEQLKKETSANQFEYLKKRTKLAQSKVDRLQSKIRRVQDGYEADPPVYTAAEAESKIAGYRHMVTTEEAELVYLRQLMDRKLVDKETAQAARQALESIRDTNLENATFAEKQNIIGKLGIKVYPSEDSKVVRILSKLNTNAEFRVSPYKISIASPKL